VQLPIGSRRMDARELCSRIAPDVPERDIAD
jgi:hypothetical protein